jgi:hypothetical protein
MLEEVRLGHAALFAAYAYTLSMNTLTICCDDISCADVRVLQDMI